MPILSVQPDEKTLAEAICTHTNRSFEEQFRNQYLLVKEPLKTRPSGWATHQYQGWTLYHSPTLPIHEIKDAAGLKVGLLIGIAIDSTNTVIDKECELPFKSETKTFFDKLDAWLTDLRGRYALFIATPSGAFMYSDPGGDIGLLFDSQTQRVGATLPLVLSRPVELHPTVSNEESLKTGASVLRFHTTADKHVQRLNPNFKLNLSNFETTRFWPKKVGIIASNDEDKQALADVISERLALNVSLFANAMKTAFPISGGYDSRILLLGAHKLNSKIDYVFSHRTNNVSGYDSMMGRELCDLLNLEHHFIDALLLYQNEPNLAQSTKSEQLSRWIRGGFSRPLMRRATLLAEVLAPNHELTLRGNIMEMLGGRFHKINDPSQAPQVFKFLYGRQPETDEEINLWNKYYKEWYSHLPDLPGKNIQDLCFLENLYPAAMGVTLLSMPTSFYLNPFADRRLIGLTMEYPSAEKQTGELYKRILNWSNPDIPIPRNPRSVAKSDGNNKLINTFIEKSTGIYS